MANKEDVAGVENYRARRYRVIPGLAPTPTFCCGGIAFDLELHLAFMQGTAIGIRPKEASLLSVLFGAAGRVVSYDEIALRLYGARTSPETSRSRLKSLVADVRRRFGSEMHHALVTVPSKGLLLYASSAVFELLEPCSNFAVSCASRDFTVLRGACSPG